MKSLISTMANDTVLFKSGRQMMGWEEHFDILFEQAKVFRTTSNKI